MAIHKEAEILRFSPVCNNFVKAQIEVVGLGKVWVLVRKDRQTGQPVFEKGEKVAYFDASPRTYKGHVVRGEIKDLSMAGDDSANWGLS